VTFRSLSGPIEEQSSDLCSIDDNNEIQALEEMCSVDTLCAQSATFTARARHSTSLGSAVGSTLSRVAQRMANALTRGESPTAAPSTAAPPPAEAVPTVLAKMTATEASGLTNAEPWQTLMVHEAKKGGLDAALAVFDAHLSTLAPSAQKPSVFILASEALRASGLPGVACAEMLFNVLETRLPDAQTCRVVAYHLISYNRFDEAVALLELIKEQLAPAEPHSYTDLAFGVFHRLRETTINHASKADEAKHVRGEMGTVIDALTKVVISIEWQSRFREIEWPALILLSWAVAWADHKLAALGEPATASLWPEDKLPASRFRLGGTGGPQLDVFVWLAWDTDHTDVDLHVMEPTGEEVYYSHNASRTTGARVSRDFTDGFGPEVYTLPKAPKGKYQVSTNYYASHQDSSSTGSTSAVVWSITNLGNFGEERVQFSSARLGRHKQRQQVLEIEIS